MNRQFFLLTLTLAALAIAGCKRSAASLEASEYQNPTMRKARACEMAGDMKNAATLYQDVLMQIPTAATAHLQLAMIYHNDFKDYIEAIHHYRRYLALRPDSEKKAMVEGRIQKADQLLATQAAMRVSANDPSGQFALMQQVGKLNASLAKTETDKLHLVETNAVLTQQIVDLTGRIKRLELWIDRLQTAPAAGGTASRRLLTPTAGATAGETASRSYEVRQGDSLSRIADFVYGDPTLWPRIRDANRDKVNNGERVRVGDILVIP